MSKIISIGTAVPAFCHRQMDILEFMQRVFATTAAEGRRMRFLYQQSGIEQRYSVFPDYSTPPAEWRFFPPTENLEPFPGLEQRMAVFARYAPALSVDAIRECLDHRHDPAGITHLITVSCTGMSAPGLELQVMELMDLPKNICRTSVNFMGCYAAIHAIRMGHAICTSEPGAKVLIVCTELCTIHFQRGHSMDNITSSLLFGDGSAALLMTSDDMPGNGLKIDGFYSEVIPGGRRDMAWELSSSGFLMTLSGYVPDLIEKDFAGIVERVIPGGGISHWCIHPGGRRILDAIHRSLGMKNGQLDASYNVLRKYGNLSSATILFVLRDIMAGEKNIDRLLAASFGPGLAVETFTAHSI